MSSRDPRQESWLTSFLDENHLNYTTSPGMVASPAQTRFMVSLEPEERYYPCTKQVFDEIMARVKSPVLSDMYMAVWSRVTKLVKAKVFDPVQQSFLLDLLNIKYQHETGNYNIIPSRLDKRLYKLFAVTSQIANPMAAEKTSENRRAYELYRHPDFARAVNSPAAVEAAAEAFAEAGLESERRRLDAAKLKRLFQASVQARYWETEAKPPTPDEWAEAFARPVAGDGWPRLEDFLMTPRTELSGHWVPRRILYLAEGSGEIVFDLAVIKYLIRLGHRVVLAVKSNTFYDLVCLPDIRTDPVLMEMTREAEFITEPNLSKNALAAHFKRDKPFQIIADGSMEELNLLLCSVTFARVFKEVDGVISRGLSQRSLLFETDFEFTQPVFSIAPTEDAALSVLYKPRSSKVVSFSTDELEAQAAKIVDGMRQAKREGMTVMFYSGIVGSIPNETETAIQVMTTFVADLKKNQAGTHIINPSEHFIQGMDADDLMYMWEIVQRSGLIDIWRFQSYQDIEKSFALLGRQVPPQWVGKDATFSTGCTKEMAIAQDVQKHNPEMQLIGPDPERFMRRSEYGIGLFHDTRLTEVYER